MVNEATPTCRDERNRYRKVEIANSDDTISLTISLKYPSILSCTQLLECTKLSAIHMKDPPSQILPSQDSKQTNKTYNSRKNSYEN